MQIKDLFSGYIGNSIDELATFIAFRAILNLMYKNINFPHFLKTSAKISITNKARELILNAF